MFTMQKMIGLMLTVVAMESFAEDNFTYELSFSNHLELRQNGQIVSITARNHTDQTIICGDFRILDLEFRHEPEGAYGWPRIWFEPTDPNSGCNYWCNPIASPPPYLVAYNIGGPLLPGEEKVCKYEVKINYDFTDSITLSSTNGPIVVTRVQPDIPVFSRVGVVFLFVFMLLLGMAHFRPKRLKSVGTSKD